MATYVYDDFRVTLTPGADGDFDMRAVGADGVTHAGTFRLPLADDEFERAVLGVARQGARNVRSTASATRDVGGDGPPTHDAEHLGGVLAAALINGDVATAYDVARRRAAGQGRGLRLTLSLADSPQLLSVPWELLYQRPRFLANQRHTPLVRHLDTPGLPQPPAIQETVRILGIVASPQDCAPLDVAAERARVERAVEKMVALGRVELDWLAPATPRGLREALRDGSYHVLHYVGHSDFTPAGDGVLYLERPDGGRAEVDSTELANLLADQTSLRLVVLNSCEGARTTLTDPYAGVATTLVHLGVPAVVAMQFEISDEAAILFAEELYTNLIGRQDPIDAAVAEARKAIYIELGTVEWATPVLFMGDVDVDLFSFEVPAAPLPPPPPPMPLATPVDVTTPRPDAQLESVARPGGAPPTAGGRRPRSLIVKAALAIASLVVLLLVGAFVYGFIEGALEDTTTGDEAGAVTQPAVVEPGPTAGPGSVAPRSGSIAPAVVDPEINPAPRTAVTSFAGEIESPGGGATYTFEAVAGEVVFLGGSGECTVNVWYELWGPADQLVDSGTLVCYDIGRVELPQSGGYTVSVDSYDGGFGPYAVELVDVPADVTSAVAVGDRLAGELTVPGQRALYTFEAVAGEVVFLGGSGECTVNVWYELWGPADQLVDSGTLVCYDIGRVELPQSGGYTVSVDSYDGGFGPYAVELVDVPADVTSAVAVGDRLAGELTVPGQRALYAFEAVAGEVVFLGGSGECTVNVWYELWGPADQLVDSGTLVCYDIGRVELPQSGGYTVSVDSYDGGFGPYEIAVGPG